MHAVAPGSTRPHAGPRGRTRLHAPRAPNERGPPRPRRTFHPPESAMNARTVLHDVVHRRPPARRTRAAGRPAATGLPLALLGALLLLVPAGVRAQGTAADYQRAEGLRERLDGLVVGVAGPPNWIGTSNRFWYRRTAQGGHEYVLVDAATLEKRPAFDHERLARALSAAADTSYTALAL